MPELTDALLDKLVAQSDAQADGASPQALERLRDDCLVSVLQGLRTHGYGAGGALADWERLLHARAPAPAAADDDAPLRLHAAVVAPEWIDYNGHAHESRYLQVFGDTTDALLRHLGFALDGGDVYMTVESHLGHLGQARAGERLASRRSCSTTTPSGSTSSTPCTGRRTARCSRPPSSCCCTSAAETGRAAPAAPAVLARVERIAAAHAALPRPERAGRAIGIARR